MNENNKASGGFSLFARYTLILSIVEAAAFCVIFGGEPTRFFLALVIVLVLDTVFLIYSYEFRNVLFKKALNYVLVSACYLVSTALVFVYGIVISVPVFIVVPCIAVIFSNAPLGIVMQSLMLSLCAFLHGGISLEMAGFFVSGVFLCLMITFANSIPSFIVSFVLCPIPVISVKLALGGFNMDGLITQDIIVSVIVDFVVLLGACFFHRFKAPVQAKVPERDLLFDIEGSEKKEPDEGAEKEDDKSEKTEDAAEAVSDEAQNDDTENADSVYDDDKKASDGFDLEGFAEANMELELLSRYELSISSCISDDFPYVVLLKNEHPKLYRHCVEVAEYASAAADLVGCDKTLAYAFGLYHEVKRVHAIEEELYACLLENYNLPRLFLKSLVDYSEKKKIPMFREVGIAALADDVITMRNYLLARKEEINGEKVVSNVIRVRKNQKLIEYCGLSETELELISEYLREILLK